MTADRILTVAIAQPAQGVHAVFESSKTPDTKAVMLAKVEQRGTHAPQDYLQFSVGELESGELAAGFSANVCDHYIGPIKNAEAAGLDAAAKIDFFAVKEELRVEEACFRESFATQDGERAGDPVDFGLEVGAGPGAVECAEDARLGVARGEAGEDHEDVPQGGECAGRGLPLAVGADEARAADSDGGVGVHVLDGEAQRSGVKEGVRVEQHLVAAPRGFHGQVVGGGKAKIDCAANEADRTG